MKKTNKKKNWHFLILIMFQSLISLIKLLELPSGCLKILILGRIDIVHKVFNLDKVLVSNDWSQKISANFAGTAIYGIMFRFQGIL